jgi:hypothetical protein
MGGPVVASGTAVRTYAIANFEGAMFDDDSHAKAVDDADTGRVRAGVCLGK